MNKSSRIYVAGHTGLVGSAITSTLVRKGYNNLISKHQSELDLTDQKAVNSFFAEEQPDYVFLAAALVGGIVANNTYRADFIYQNIMIQSNIIHASWKYKVKKLLFLGSTCIYPKNAPQPMKEDYLLTSPLEHTNEPYAIAKIAGLKMCESFNIQYNTNFIAVMPTNLYGPGDNFNLEKSHVLPALMRKIHLGKCLENGDWTGIRKDLNKNPIEKISGDSGEKDILDIFNKYGIKIVDEPGSARTDEKNGNHDPLRKVAVNVWGTGTPFREFMYSLDMAEACVYVVENVNINNIIELNKSVQQADYHSPHFINIGTGEEISIKDLAFRIKKLIGFRGNIVFDLSKPDGPIRKATDATLLKKLGYSHKYNLDAGLAETYDNYLRAQSELK
jgi:GDP-L-fucose synthase